MNFDFLVDERRWDQVGSSKFWEENEDGEPSILIPRIKNESDQKRAERILEQMKSSSDRLDRILSFFDRISR